MYSVIQFLSDRREGFLGLGMFILVTLQAFLGPLDLEVYPNKISVGLDKTVAVKLFVAGLVSLTAIWGVLNFATVRRAMTTIPVLAILFFIMMTILGGASSRITSAAIPTAVVNGFNLIFVITVINFLGLRIFSLGIILGCMVTAVYGLYLFYLFPDRGIFTEPIHNGQFVNRIGGLAHPNSIGRTMCVATVLTIYLYRVRELPFSIFVLFMLPLGWNIVLAKSRTAMLACIFSILVFFVDRLKSRLAVAMLVVVSIVGLGGVFGLFAAGKEAQLVDKFVNTFSKTGNINELTSGTGRNVIWAEATKFVAQKPLIGWGLNSGPVLLIDHSQSTHNAIMNAMVSGGILAGIVMIGLQLWLLNNVFQSPNLMIRAMSTLLFISCLTEDTIMETFPGPCSMLWYMCIIYPVMEYVPIKPLSSLITNFVVPSDNSPVIETPTAQPSPAQ